jgi:hypothetical protein
VDVAEEARVELFWAWMTDANVWPFCKRLIFWLAGVLGLKKASQFVLIAVTAEELPPGDGAADADVAGALADAPEPGEPELLLLLQAVAAAASTTPRTGTRTAR